MRNFLVDITFELSGKVITLTYYLLGWHFISMTGKVLGKIIHLLNIKKRMIAEGELRSLLGGRCDDAEVKRITKKSFEDYYMRRAETIFFGRLNKDTITDIVAARGLENLDNALSKGKGAILLLSHFGSFLLPLPYLGFLGYRVNQITGRQIHTSKIDERVWAWRKKEADRLPVRFIQVERFLRPIYDALGNNEIVAIAFDGRSGTKWVEVKFFGRRAFFSSGPFELARRTRAEIIPTFIVRGEDNRYTLFLEPAFELSADPDPEKAVHVDTQKFSDIFSDYIDRYPSHFGMVLYKLRMDQEKGIGKPLFVEN